MYIGKLYINKLLFSYLLCYIIILSHFALIVNFFQPDLQFLFRIIGDPKNESSKKLLSAMSEPIQNIILSYVSDPFELTLYVFSVHFFVIRQRNEPKKAKNLSLVKERFIKEKVVLLTAHLRSLHHLRQ